MNCSPVTKDYLNKAIDRAINCLRFIPIPLFNKAIYDLEIAKLLINKDEK